jgi:hypothetical protein
LMWNACTDVNTPQSHFLRAFPIPFTLLSMMSQTLSSRTYVCMYGIAGPKYGPQSRSLTARVEACGPGARYSNNKACFLNGILEL